MKAVLEAVTFCLLVTLPVTPALAGGDPPQLGEVSPPLGVTTWFRGDAAAGEPALEGPVTVLEFWGTWCPASRIVLARHDSLQAVLGDRATFVAVTREDPAGVRRFLDQAGWRHLLIGCDTTGEVARTFLRTPPGTEALDPRRLPYAYVLDNRGKRHRNTILWMGSVVDPEAEDPLVAFETALDEILSGNYDLASAIEVARQEARSVELFKESAEALKADDLDGIARFLDEITGIKLAAGYENTLATNMNSLAWELVTREGRGERHLELAGRACRIGLDAGGDANPDLLDTYARVLYETGDIEEAHEVQARAVELGKGSSAYAQLRKSLDLYREKLGLSPDPEAGEAPGPEAAETPVPWSGTLNAVWKAFEKARMVVVRPATAAGADREAAWTAQIEGLQGSFFQKARFRLPDAVSQEERETMVLVLYGTTSTNRLTAEILDRCGIEVLADGVRVGDRRLAAEDPVLITCVPNPWNPSLPVVIYTAYAEKDDLGLNNFFHGPTALVLGRWNGGKPEVLHALDYLPGNGSGEGGGVSLAIGPAVLGPEEAVEDLRRLRDLLELHYAGYADLDWELRAGGASWAEHTAQFERRILEGGSLSWSAFFDLLRDYLKPVEDTHFYMTGSGSEGRDVIDREATFVRNLVPFFSDLRVTGKDGAFIVAETPEPLAGLLGSEIAGVAVVGTPHAVHPGVPYLFPTLPVPRRGVEPKPGETNYLVGVLAPEASPPDTVAVGVRSLAGTASGESVHGGKGVREIRLPLHRGGSSLGRRRGGSGWGLALPPKTPIAVLAVRTMYPNLLEGMAETADTLRTLPRVVLDLRRNGGGSDIPAMHWCQRFSGQPYEWAARVGHWSGRSDPLRAWLSYPGSTRPRIAGPSVPSAPEPYPGRLFVLVDKGVYSSGETFAQLAGQVQGAILVGENTAGCVAYGNVEPHDPLPHSRIRFSFGRTRFVVDWVRPTREGVGFFPDYWLDTRDPVGVIADADGANAAPPAPSR